MKITNMLMLMTVLIFSACKKNGNDTGKISTTCKIVSIKEGNDPASTYTYDENGKVSKVTNLYGFGNGTFSYQSGSVTFNNSGDGSTESFITDGSGRITSDQYDTYKYNAEGYLIEKTGKSSTTPEFVLSYSNGNLIKVITDGTEISDITYYDSETTQNLLGYENALWSSLLFNEHTFSNFTATMIGKGSKNLVKSIMMKRQENGITLQFTDSYAYKKDADGKIVSMVITSQADGGFFNGVSTVNFTYQCQ